MPNLIGTAPNQVPTNGSLGSMAFQNKEAVKTDLLTTTALTVTGTGALTVGGTQIVKDASGNVGIGTSTPGTRLEVADATTATVRLRRTDSANGSGSISSVGNTGVTNAVINLGGGVNNLMSFEVNGSERMRIDSAGNVGIGTSSPTAKLDVNADTVRVRTAKTPASATAAGNAGDICWDANYVYVCVATNTWKRSALSTW